MKIMHVKAQSPTGEWFNGNIACGDDGWPQFVQSITSEAGEEISFLNCTLELYHNLMGEAQTQAQVTQGEAAHTPTANDSPIPRASLLDCSDYDSGLLNDWGGGRVQWWQDYIRSEVARCNDYWREIIEGLRT